MRPRTVLCWMSQCHQFGESVTYKKNQILCLTGGVHWCSGWHLGRLLVNISVNIASRYISQVLAAYWPMCKPAVTCCILLIDVWSLLGRQFADISPRDHRQIIDVGYCLSTDVAAKTSGWIHESIDSWLTVGHYVGRFKSTILATTQPIWQSR